MRITVPPGHGIEDGDYIVVEGREMRVFGSLRRSITVRRLYWWETAWRFAGRLLGVLKPVQS